VRESAVDGAAETLDVACGVSASEVTGCRHAITNAESANASATLAHADTIESAGRGGANKVVSLRTLVAALLSSTAVNGLEPQTERRDN
jgi:hypothetical protein